jgi:hypothetical protein
MAQAGIASADKMASSIVRRMASSPYSQVAVDDGWSPQTVNVVHQYSPADGACPAASIARPVKLAHSG